MSEMAFTALFVLVGFCVLVVAVVILVMRNGGSQSVTWRGLGITFEIKPDRPPRERRVVP